MKLLELTQRAKQARPELEALPDVLVASMLDEVFKQIKYSIETTEKGVVKVDRLGQFSIRPVERAVGGKIVVDKRTVFRAESPSRVSLVQDASHASDRIPRIQGYNSTRYNRYKGVFAAVKDILGDPEKILSFGCSYGDEPLSLAELWFPKARILGVDVSEECLRVAKERTASVCDRVEIAYSSESIIAAWAPFDIVFAMSVLCAWPHSKDLEDISPLYTFAEFENHVALLSAALRPGGLLVIWNSSFRFADTAAAQEFEEIHAERINESGFVKKFGSDNKALAKQNYPFFVFRKCI